MEKAKRQDKVDDIVSTFTKQILDLAVKEGINFAYIGKRPSKADEVIAVLKEDAKVVSNLLK